MNGDKSETDVIVKLISPFLEKLGYKENIQGEVEHEKSLEIGRSKYVFPDIVININGVPAFVVDAKKPTENLDLYERQIISYGLLLKTPYSILCNGLTFRVYETQTEKIIWEKSLDKIPSFLSKDKLEKKLHKTIDIVSEERISEAKKNLLVFEGIKEFSTILYKCEDVIRDKDGLTGADAFDEISKLLFTKMYFEKKAMDSKVSEMSFKNITERGGAEYVKNYLFPQVIKNNKDIFIGDEKIGLEDETVEKIIEILEGYTLIKTDIDVKGRAFEIFLGKTFTGGLGQFFTPRSIVKFAVTFADPEINSTLSKNHEPFLVCDTSCGSGGFLIEVFQHIKEKIKKLPQNKQSDLIERLSRKQLFGVDINPRLVRVSKMNMVLHGDGHGGIYKYDGLQDIKEIKENSFDLIVTNPPFGNKDKGKILEKFELGKPGGRKIDKQLREVLFLERCVRLLKKGGELAIVLPDGILNNEMLSYVRDYLRRETIIKAVISLPDGSFKASGANSKTSILFLKKKLTHDEKQHPIFMAVAEEVGYDRRTKDAKEIDQNDLPDIFKAYQLYKASKSYENLKNKDDVFEILNDKPASFIIGEKHIGSRLDATYYYSKYVFELDGKSSIVKNVAKLSRVIVNPNKQPTQAIRYVQFSDVEKILGSIVNIEEIFGEEAPTRARQQVDEGDVICAKVKDSEENVAIVPKELDKGIVSTGFIVLKPIAPMTTECLYALLRLKTTLLQVRWKSSGTIMPTISEDEYLTIKIPCLKPAEIERITKEIKEVEKQRKSVKAKLTELSLRLQ